MKVAVVGLGKIGLPLAVKIAESGAEVWGLDSNRRVVTEVNDGRVPFPGEPELPERLASVAESGTLVATDSASHAVTDADVVVVVVPLIVDGDGQPIYEGVDEATQTVGRHLKRGALVVYETTVPVGTTRGRFGPLLESASGFAMGADFYLAFSPERVSSGSVFRDLARYPKLVGALDRESGICACRFYESFLGFVERADLARPNGVWFLESCEAAEFAKLAETTYRDVSIALANEFAAHAEELGLDFSTIAEACNSQPYSHILRPGVSVGGHCIPVYPHFYEVGDALAQLPGTARSVNRRQPARAAERLSGLMGGLSGTTIAILGVAYRGGVKEVAFSGAFDLAKVLTSMGAKVVAYDPLYDESEIEELGFSPYALGHPTDGVIIHTDHEEFRTLLPDDLPECRAILDGRGLLDRRGWERATTRLASVGRGLV